jgi:hypothetical protein
MGDPVHLGKRRFTKRRIKKYQEGCSAEFLSSRELLGIKRYRKWLKRDGERRKILLELG